MMGMALMATASGVMASSARRYQETASDSITPMTTPLINPVITIHPVLSTAVQITSRFSTALERISLGGGRTKPPGCTTRSVNSQSNSPPSPTTSGGEILPSRRQNLMRHRPAGAMLRAPRLLVRKTPATRGCRSRVRPARLEAQQKGAPAAATSPPPAPTETPPPGWNG